MSTPTLMIDFFLYLLLRLFPSFFLPKRMTLIKAVEGFHVSYLFRKLGGVFYDERSSLSIEPSMCTVLSVKLKRF